jgi:hypothetical protein
VAKNTIKLLDFVALTVDIPEYNLWRRQVGTVVELLADGAALEVEFSDRNGRTYDIMSGSITIIKPQLGATNGSLSNLELSLAVGVIVGSD